MSLTRTEYGLLSDIEERQRKELKELKEISRKQDRHIAILERIVRILERREDDGK